MNLKLSTPFWLLLSLSLPSIINGEDPSDSESTIPSIFPSYAGETIYPSLGETSIYPSEEASLLKSIYPSLGETSIYPSEEASGSTIPSIFPSYAGETIYPSLGETSIYPSEENSLGETSIYPSGLASGSTIPSIFPSYAGETIYPSLGETSIYPSEEASLLKSIYPSLGETSIYPSEEASGSTIPSIFPSYAGETIYPSLGETSIYPSEEASSPLTVGINCVGFLMDTQNIILTFNADISNVDNAAIETLFQNCVNNSRDDSCDAFVSDVRVVISSRRFLQTANTVTLAYNVATLTPGRDIFESLSKSSFEEQFNNNNLGLPELQGATIIVRTEAPTAAPTRGSELPPTGGEVMGDPHFKKWNGERYDFHGVCDLVMLQNSDFENGIGMDIHIRTKKMRFWSYISTAVVRIGNDALEVMGGQGINRYWINEILGDDISDGAVLSMALSGFPISYQKPNYHRRVFAIELNNGERIILKTWNDMVSVDVLNPTVENFGSSMGLLGSFLDSKNLFRDNRTVVQDVNEFGQEWQVLPTELKLFQEAKGPQAPEPCEIPSFSEMRRRLATSEIRLVDAKNACAGVTNKEELEVCIFDVMATGDMSVAGAY